MTHIYTFFFWLPLDVKLFSSVAKFTKLIEQKISDLLRSIIEPESRETGNLSNLFILSVLDLTF